MPRFGKNRRIIHMRRFEFMLFAAIVLLTGCRPAQSANNAPPPPTPDSNPLSPGPMPTVARIHWLGMNQLAGQTNAASLMAVWNLPETGRLKQQTLDKSSLAPWRLLHRSMDTNAAARLRPLLDDLVADESYLEIRRAGNQPGDLEELALAIRLDDSRAALWQTNLARVLESLTGITPVPDPNHHGWSLKKHHAPNLIQMTRMRGWTIVGAADDHIDLMAELASRIQRGQPLMTPDHTNDWLTADIHPAQLIPGLATLNSQLSTLDHFHLAMTGAGSNVLTQGTADFRQPLALDLESWNPPTNLINWQVCSFTAIRGLGPWLKSSKAWNDLQIGPPPDQACFWAVPGSGMHSYFAAPLLDASNEVSRFTDWVLQNQGRLFPTNQLARFERSKEFNGLQWQGLPYMWPFLRSITDGHQNFAYAGGFANPNPYGISGKWLQEALGDANLVYYDSEDTGQRISQWIYMGQFARYVSHHAQLPDQSPAMLWLKAISPKLNYSITRVTETASSQLSFSRRSSIGFTAIELNLLADWLESPEFPVGVHSLRAPPDQVK